MREFKKVPNSLPPEENAIMSTTTPENTHNSILERVILPENPTLSAEVAKEFLKWDLSPKDRERMAVLAAKAREGALSNNEQYEIEEYELLESFLGIVHSKARRSLKLASSQ